MSSRQTWAQAARWGSGNGYSNCAPFHGRPGDSSACLRRSSILDCRRSTLYHDPGGFVILPMSTPVLAAAIAAKYNTCGRCQVELSRSIGSRQVHRRNYHESGESFRNICCRAAPPPPIVAVFVSVLASHVVSSVCPAETHIPFSIANVLLAWKSKADGHGGLHQVVESCHEWPLPTRIQSSCCCSDKAPVVMQRTLQRICAPSLQSPYLLSLSSIRIPINDTIHLATSCQAM